MAVAGVPGGGYSMTANTDVLNQATIGHPHLSAPARVRVRGITFVTNGTAPAGVTTLKSGGGSGVTIYSAVPSLNTPEHILAEPFDVDDLALTAISTNVTAVIVHIA